MHDRSQWWITNGLVQLYVLLAAKIDLGKLNDYKIFSTLIFLPNSHWVRRFLINQSIAFSFSKATLLFIDVAPTMIA